MKKGGIFKNLERDLQSLLNREMNIFQFMKRHIGFVIYIIIIVNLVMTIFGSDKELAKDYYNTAVSAYEQQDYETALSKVYECLDLMPDNEEAKALLLNIGQKYAEIAENFYNQGDYKSAYENADIAIGISDSAAEIYEKSKEAYAGACYDMAVAENSAGNYQGAIDYLNIALGLKGEYPEASELLASAEQAYKAQLINQKLEEIEVFRSQENYVECLNKAQEILAIDSQNQRGQELVAEFTAHIHKITVDDLKAKMEYEIQNYNFDQAKAYANQLIQLEPENQEFAGYIGRIDAELQKHIDDVNRVLAKQEAQAKANEAISSGSVQDIKAAYGSADAETKQYIKDMCEQKVLERAKADAVNIVNYNATSYRVLYNDLSAYNAVGYTNSSKINKIISVVDSLFKVQTEIDNARNTTYSGKIKSFDDVTVLSGNIISRVQNSGHINIAGYDITDKYLDEYMFVSYTGYEAVIVSSEPLSRGEFYADVVYVGTGTYVDSDGFETEYEKYQVISVEEMQEFENYENIKYSIETNEKKKASLIKEYQSLVK